MVDEEGVVDDEEWSIEQEIEPEGRRGVQPEQMIEKGQRDECAIDGGNERQRPHLRPLTLKDEQESSRAIAQDDRANEAVEHR